MTKPRKERQIERTKEEARALFEHTVKRMLSTPPRPHESAKKKPKPARRKSD